MFIVATPPLIDLGRKKPPRGAERRRDVHSCESIHGDGSTAARRSIVCVARVAGLDRYRLAATAAASTAPAPSDAGRQQSEHEKACIGVRATPIFRHPA